LATSTNRAALHYANSYVLMSILPRKSILLLPKPYFQYPQTLLQRKGPHFTPIRNNKQNCSLL